MRSIVLLLLIVTLLTCRVVAQNTLYDSAKVIKTARHNAKPFRLKSTDLERFNAEHFPTASDYFKPTVETSDTVLLKDSLYVQTYRTTAFYNVVNQRPNPNLNQILFHPHDPRFSSRPVY